jgi:phage FluMu gp28-like protein
MHLLDAYESKRVRHPVDARLRDDLRKPERIVSADGRVSIAAARTAENHADHFWSLALAAHAAQRPPAAVMHVPAGFERVRIPRREFVG